MAANEGMNARAKADASSFENPGQEFEKPPSSSSEQAQVEEFASPDDTGSGAEEAAFTEGQNYATAIPSSLLEIKSQVQQLLQQSAVNGAQEFDVSDDQNIVGVGISTGVGASFDDSLSAGVIPGEPALVVYVRNLSSLDAVKSSLSSSIQAASFSEDRFPLHVVETGLVEARSNTQRVRPAPCGFSIGHYKITAGTMGALARGRNPPRNARVLALSNNHVLAAVNQGVYGDCIVQPGPYDGGKCPADQIAILERYVPINFAAGASNTVDCATGWTWHDRVRPEQAYLSGSTIYYFHTSSAPVQPMLNMVVGKTGRTTGLTTGRITAVGVAVNVSYGAGQVAHFVDQVAIQSLNANPFSAGGDSGSLIWTWNNVRNPVALLFAGGGNTTFANRITSVLNALDINLWT